jgi:MFS family permease
MMPSFAGIMKANYPDERLRGMLIAKVRMGITLASMTAAYIGGWVLNLREGNYHYIFPLAALFGITSSLVFSRIRVRGEKHIGQAPREKKTLASFTGIFRVFREDPIYLRYSIAFFIAGFGTIMISPLIPIYWVDDLRLGHFQAGWLGSLSAIGLLIAFWVWGSLLKRSHPVRCLIWLFLLNCLFPALYILSSLALGHGMPDAGFHLVVVAQFLLGFINAGWELLWLVGVVSFGSLDKAPQYAALQTISLGIRGFIAPFTGTWLLGIWGKRPVWALSAILMMTGAWLMVRVYREHFSKPL